MKKLFITLIVITVIVCPGAAQVSLTECLTMAHDNYPVIKKYDILSATEDVQISDINKSWLPRVGVYAQATVQNIVPSFPPMLSNIMEQMGADVAGLGKIQYKAGIDVNQTIWDGGASRAQRQISHANTSMQRASLDVEMYSIRQRVQSLYFAILLIETQIEQTESAISVYEANLERLKSMVENGTAMQSDADMVEAQLLGMKQQVGQAKSACSSYRQMLSIFTGADMTSAQLALPSEEIPADLSCDRPELNLFSMRQRVNDARIQAVNSSLMPRMGFFAQSYYGYPGIDYFKAMMNRNMTFNIVAGVKVSWNIDSFYYKKNSLQKIRIDNLSIDSDRDTFLMNNSLQTSSQLSDIHAIQDLMEDDARIVALRTNVRIAAESQLRNGIIDATALTTKINDETQAILAASYHRIQLAQAIYNLKNTLNR